MIVVPTSSYVIQHFNFFLESTNSPFPRQTRGYSAAARPSIPALSTLCVFCLALSPKNLVCTSSFKWRKASFPPVIQRFLFYLLVDPLISPSFFISRLPPQRDFPKSDSVRLECFSHTSLPKKKLVQTLPFPPMLRRCTRCLDPIVIEATLSPPLRMYIDLVLEYSSLPRRRLF